MPIQPIGAGHAVALHGGAMMPRGISEAMAGLIAAQSQAQRLRRKQEASADEAHRLVKELESGEDRTPRRRVEAMRPRRQRPGRLDYLA